MHKKPYIIFVSSPSDIKPIRDKTPHWIEEWSQNKGLGFPLIIKSDEDLYPQVNHPQNYLNTIINKCDLIIATFWHRFGSPTAKYDSGTQEEIEESIKNKKDIMVYFCEMNFAYHDANPEQWLKVVNYKKELIKRITISSYVNEKEFKIKLIRDLENYFKDKREIPEQIIPYKKPFLKFCINPFPEIIEAYGVSSMTDNSDKTFGFTFTFEINPKNTIVRIEPYIKHKVLSISNNGVLLEFYEDYKGLLMLTLV